MPTPSNNISHYYSFYYSFEQINPSLVSISIQSSFVMLKLLKEIWSFVQTIYVVSVTN